MSLGLFKNVIYKMCLEIIHLIYMYVMVIYLMMPINSDWLDKRGNWV